MSPSPEPLPQQLFLRGQQLSALTGVAVPKQRCFYVCGGRSDEGEEAASPREPARDPWQPQDRTHLCQKAAGATPDRRVALVCSAGLGKTTNMAWLAARI